jgi:RNA recognition motif-containing protein
MDTSIVKLFVGGLPTDIDEIELVQLVAIYGEVLTIKIVRDRATKKSKGYAFLEMANLEAAQNVINSLDGEPFRKKNLFFSLVKEKSVVTPVNHSSSKWLPTYKKVTTDVDLNKIKRRRN